MPNLERLARSLRDAKDIVDELTRREVKLSIAGPVHDPTDPVERLLFNVPAMVGTRKWAAACPSGGLIPN